MKNLLLAICAWVFSGCILLSGVGDSNTLSTAGHDRWVKRAQPLIPSSVTFESARGGSSIADFMNCTGDCATTTCGRELLQCTLTANHPNRVILAFGTNDIVYLYGQGGTLDDIVTAYQDRVTEAGSTATYVALTPPVFCGTTGFSACTLPYNEPNVEQLNALLVAHFGTANLVDFWTGFVAAEYNTDGIHLNDAGQQHRAQVAADFINSH